MWLRELHALALFCGASATLEPSGVAATSGIRPDLRLNGFGKGGGDVYVDVRTYVHTRPSTAALEAQLPGMQCDRFENAKVRKHLPAILANNPSDAFYPMCISEHGTVGPQGAVLLDLLFARAACPAAAKAYWMRRLHVTTARRVHAIMHTQLRGYESPTAPAPQPAAEALSVQTDAANDDDGGEDDAPRVVLPLHPEGLPPDALGALRQQEVHEDDDSRHMWLQEAVAGGDEDSDGDGGVEGGGAAALSGDRVVRACFSAMATTTAAASQTDSPATPSPGG